MLRITTIAESPSLTTLKLEGRIVSDWVSLLERECLTLLQEKQQVLLDLSDVLFIDARGVEMLKRIANENLEVINSSAFIESLLRGEGDQ